MAEAVQQQLERQLDELHDLRKRGIFTTAEIRQIVKRRKAYEYSLRRRQTRLSDFVAYIRYEVSVDALREARKKKLGIQKKNTVSDFSIIQRIHFTFARALQKFKGDVKLWHEYFRYCTTSKSNKLLGKAFAQAIQYHPLNVGMWVSAAKWEFEENNNAEAARVLLQRALRINSTSKDLWREYFRFELLYWEKMSRRAEVLGIANVLATKEELAAIKPAMAREGDVAAEESDGGESEGDESSDSEGEYAFRTSKPGVSLPTLKEEEGLSLEAGEKRAADPFLSGFIPKIVYKRAIAAIPDDVEFQLSFLAIYRLFPNTESHQEELYAALTPCEQSLDARARRPYHDFLASDRPVEYDDLGMEIDRGADPAAIADAVALYEDALKTFPTVAMWHYYVAFLDEIIKKTPFKVDLAASLGAQILSVCERYSAASPKPAGEREAEMHERIVLTHAAHLVAQHKTPEALAALKAQADKGPSALLWSRYIQLFIAHRAPKWSEVDALFARFAVLSKQQKVDEEDLLQMAQFRISCATVASDECSVAQLDAIYWQGVAAGLVQLMIPYLEWSHLSGGIASARRAYERLQSVPHGTGLALAQHMLALEHAHLRTLAPALLPASKAQRDECIAAQRRIATVFERVLGQHGATAEDTWLDYITFELGRQEYERASTLYWRAVKALEAPDEFINRYNALRLQLAL